MTKTEASKSAAQARIAQLTKQMDALRRPNGTLPSLATKAGKLFASLEFARDELKHAAATGSAQ